MRKQKGFTLIELLVVIAIIGILAAIVLVSLSGARDRAKDARIQSGMGQIRAVAEIEYNDSDYSYDDLFTMDTGEYTNEDVETLVTDIDGNAPTGESFTGQDSDGAYCAYVPLNRSGYHCVDSKGFSDSVDTDPSGSGYCDGTTFVCPST